MNRYLEKIAEELEKEASIAGAVRRGLRTVKVVAGRSAQTGRSYAEGFRGKGVDVKKIQGTKSIDQLESHVKGQTHRKKIGDVVTKIQKSPVTRSAVAGAAAGAAAGVAGAALSNKKKKD